MEFAPLLVNNAGSTVTFKCAHATPLDLIRATGQQTRFPIGVVLGEDLDALSKPVRSYDLENVNARDALLEAIQGTTFSLREENHVAILFGGDITRRQQQLLMHRYAYFNPSQGATTVELGAYLNEWMWAAINPAQGSLSSIGGSLNDERFTLTPMKEATTEEIANRIVSLGSKGMWIFRVAAFHPTDASADQIEVESYQHYSNRPYIEH
ncbi:MAG TPA: hypothetical protein VFW25_00960 [Silvibacterium sp.]|nr:hypothetical protein [Silvibacterium sp.]